MLIRPANQCKKVYVIYKFRHVLYAQIIMLFLLLSYYAHQNNSNEFLLCFQSSNRFYFCYFSFYGDSKRYQVSFAGDGYIILCTPKWIFALFPIFKSILSLLLFILRRFKEVSSFFCRWLYIIKIMFEQIWKLNT